MLTPGIFYPFIPSRLPYGGIGTGNDAFVYPWSKPAFSYAGVGDANASQIKTVGPDQQYYYQRVTNAPAQGGGTLAGTVAYTPLFDNSGNTAGL